MISHKLGNTSFKAGVLGLTFAAVAATFLVAPAATAAPKNWAPAVCMINAPNSSLGYGHVGWAVREASNQWYLGGTEGSNQGDNWDEAYKTDAEFHQLFRDRGNYQTYRCHDYAAGSIHAAKAAYDAAYKRGYATFTDNCLTRAADIFNRFTNTNWFGNPTFTPPNDYYNGTLDDLGFGPRQNL